MADDMDIHPVQTKTHNAAQTGRAKGQRRIEAADNFFLILRDAGQFLPLCIT